MNAVTEYYREAELALAAYATLSAGISGNAYTDALIDNGKGMSQSQAERFAATWSVVDQYTDPWSGFSATLFENGGQRYLAIRGTNDPIDLLADVDLALFNGVAAKQTVALYNYVQRLKGVKNEAVAQLEWSVLQQSYVLNPTGALGLLDAPLSGPITVAGHSLGGHLAMAFGRLFPQDTAQIYTYNAPGFVDLFANNLFEQLDAALGRAGSSFQDGLTTNLHGSGLNVIAGYADDHGTPQEILAESTSHSIVTLTDALAVHDLYARVDGSLAARPIASTTPPTTPRRCVTDCRTPASMCCSRACSIRLRRGAQTSTAARTFHEIQQAGAAGKSQPLRYGECRAGLAVALAAKAAQGNQAGACRRRGYHFRSIDLA